jgi:hypothetical protein
MNFAANLLEILQTPVLPNPNSFCHCEPPLGDVAIQDRTTLAKGQCAAVG